jgi:hypothetical protein
MREADPIAVLKDLCQHLEQAETAWDDQEWFRQRNAKTSALAAVAPALLTEIDNLKASLSQFQLTLAL